jgi:hypothetical protein
MKIEDLLNRKLKNILGAPCKFKDPYTGRPRKGTLMSIAVGRAIVRDSKKVGVSLLWDDVISVNYLDEEVG